MDKFVPISLLSGDVENKIIDIKNALKLAQNIEKLGRELLIKGLAKIVECFNIANDDIANDGIANDDIANDNIANDNIANDNITNDDITNDDITNDDITNTKSKHIFIEHPTRIIIDKFFKEFSFSNLNFDSKFDIVDGYNYNNELKYSNMNYKKFPPWGNLSLIEKNLHGYKMKQIFPFGIEKFLHNEGKKKIYTETKAEEVIAQSKKLDGEPMYTASSWIEK
jgi:hypothetical protein